MPIVVPEEGYLAYPFDRPDKIQKYFIYERKYDAMRWPHFEDNPRMWDPEGYLDYESEQKTPVRGYLLGLTGVVSIGIVLISMICG